MKIKQRVRKEPVNSIKKKVEGEQKREVYESAWKEFVSLRRNAKREEEQKSSKDKAE